MCSMLVFANTLRNAFNGTRKADWELHTIVAEDYFSIDLS